MSGQDKIIRDYQTTITILEHISDAIFILSDEGAIQYANHAATDLLGLPLQELLGRQLEDFLNHPLPQEGSQDVDEERSFLDRVFQSGYQELETRVKRAAGEIEALINFGIVPQKDGSVQYLIVSLRDISQYRRLEKEMLQQRLLEESRDRFREMGEMAVQIVHRLSQPVTTAQLLVERVKKNIENGKANEKWLLQQCAEITHMLSLMSEVIVQIRHYAHLTEEEHLKRLDIREYVNHAIHQLEYELTENNIQLDIQQDKNLPMILANPINLQRIFITLIRYLLDGRLGESRRRIGLQIRNVHNRRVEVFIYAGEETTLIDNTKMREQGERIIQTHFNLNLIRLVLSTLGGDFRYFVSESAGHLFLLRFPADHDNEREALLNMIDLLN